MLMILCGYTLCTLVIFWVYITMSLSLIVSIEQNSSTNIFWNSELTIEPLARYEAHTPI